MSRTSKSSAESPPSALVVGMAARDERALGAFYDAYGHVSYGLALAITGRETSAESVVSEAFAEAWASASSFDASRTSVLAWLTTIVRRIALRVSRRPGTDSPAYESGGQGVGELTSAPTPMSEALRALTAPQRRVIELSYFRGLTVGEIAAQLGAPESETRELVRLAMRELRLALSGPAAFEDHVVTRA
jgi:RNA polymerase sigma-70 factor (ECF subfamily)